MLTPSFYPNIGGVERHVLKISMELIKEGHSITILTEKRKRTAKNYEIYKGIKIYRIRPSVISRFLFLLKNINLIRQADVIQIHDFTSFVLWYFPFRFIFPKKPVFVTFHGFDGIPIPKSAIILRKITESLVSDHICVGKYIQKWYGTRCNHITYGAVEPINEDITEEIDIVFIGRLEPDMDIQLYLQSLKILKEKYSIKVQMDIIGDGTLRHFVESFAKKNELSITIHGKIPNPEKIMAKGKIVLANGYLSILEASMLKKPIIAAYNSDLKRDYLYSMPMEKLIILNNANEIAKMIKRLLEDPTLRFRIGTTNFNYAKQQTWKKIIEMYLDMYNKTQNKK